MLEDINNYFYICGIVYLDSKNNYTYCVATTKHLLRWRLQDRDAWWASDYHQYMRSALWDSICIPKEFVPLFYAIRLACYERHYFHIKLETGPIKDPHKYRSAIKDGVIKNMLKRYNKHLERQNTKKHYSTITNAAIKYFIKSNGYLYNNLKIYRIVPDKNTAFIDRLVLKSTTEILKNAKNDYDKIYGFNWKGNSLAAFTTSLYVCENTKAVIMLKAFLLAYYDRNLQGLTLYSIYDKYISLIFLVTGAISPENVDKLPEDTLTSVDKRGKIRYHLPFSNKARDLIIKDILLYLLTLIEIGILYESKKPQKNKFGTTLGLLNTFVIKQKYISSFRHVLAQIVGKKVNIHVISLTPKDLKTGLFLKRSDIDNKVINTGIYIDRTYLHFLLETVFKDYDRYCEFPMYRRPSVPVQSIKVEYSYYLDALRYIETNLNLQGDNTQFYCRWTEDFRGRFYRANLPNWSTGPKFLRHLFIFEPKIYFRNPKIVIQDKFVLGFINDTFNKNYFNINEAIRHVNIKIQMILSGKGKITRISRESFWPLLSLFLNQTLHVGHVDAKCSSYQNAAALLQNVKIGEMVGIYPSTLRTKDSDIYTYIANKTVAFIEQDNPTHYELFQKYCKNDKRRVFKKIVITAIYNSKPYSTKDYAVDAIDFDRDDRELTSKMYKIAYYIARTALDQIQQEFPDVFNFITDFTSFIKEAPLHRIKLQDGFFLSLLEISINKRHITAIKRGVELEVNGKFKRHELDDKKIGNACFVNLVHAHDAIVMLRWVELCKSIPVMPLHDCLFCSSYNVYKLQRLGVQAYKDVYTKDMLITYLKTVKINDKDLNYWTNRLGKHIGRKPINPDILKAFSLY